MYRLFVESITNKICILLFSKWYAILKIIRILNFLFGYDVDEYVAAFPTERTLD